MHPVKLLLHCVVQSVVRLVAATLQQHTSMQRQQRSASSMRTRHFGSRRRQLASASSAKAVPAHHAGLTTGVASPSVHSTHRPTHHAWPELVRQRVCGGLQLLQQRRRNGDVVAPAGPVEQAGQHRRGFKTRGWAGIAALRGAGLSTSPWQTALHSSTPSSGAAPMWRQPSPAQPIANTTSPPPPHHHTFPPTLRAPGSRRRCEMMPP